MLYRLTWPLMKGFMWTVFKLLGGFRAQETENVPRTGGVLICPNHLSDADPAAVAVALPRSAYFMAKAELFDIPVLGVLVRHFRGFPIKRNSADRAALRRAEELLRAGEAVVIFPEGGGNPDGTLQPLNPGAMLIALRTRVPVIPAAVANSNRVWPYGDVAPRYAGVPVSVTFGPPLDLSDLYEQRRGSEKATARLTETLADMLGQAVPEGKPRSRKDDAAEAEA